MQQSTPARGRHCSWLGDSTKHTALNCFQSQPLTNTNWLVLIVCFDSAFPVKRRGEVVTIAHEAPGFAGESPQKWGLTPGLQSKMDMCACLGSPCGPGSELPRSWSHRPGQEATIYIQAPHAFSRRLCTEVTHAFPLPPSQLSLMCQSCYWRYTTTMKAPAHKGRAGMHRALYMPGTQEQLF